MVVHATRIKVCGSVLNWRAAKFWKLIIELESTQVSAHARTRAHTHTHTHTLTHTHTHTHTHSHTQTHTLSYRTFCGGGDYSMRLCWSEGHYSINLGTSTYIEVWNLYQKCIFLICQNRCVYKTNYIILKWVYTQYQFYGIQITW
jgi:hypothetical protein